MVRELYDENECVEYNRNIILAMTRKFYTNLYAEKLSVFNEDTKNLFFKNVKKLSKNGRKACEGKITKDECLKVLNAMK